MHLFVSLTPHGWHPAAWRLTSEPLYGARELLDAARAAESAGFDAVLFGLPPRDPGRPGDGSIAGVRFDPLPVIGAAIGATERIGLGAYWPLDVAEPFHVARVFATLDHLSAGRTAWITGLTGAAALKADFGYRPLLDDPTEAAQRADEFVAVAMDLLDSWEDGGFVVDQASGTFADPDRVHPIHHQGPFFTVRGPLNVPRPPQGRPVVIHRDSGPGALRQAATSFADAILIESETLEDAVALRRELRAAAPAKRQEPLAVVATIMPILAETDVAARRRADKLDALQRTTGPRFIGTPAAFADLMARWCEAGACDGFDLRPAVSSVDLGQLTGSVLPRLRTRGHARPDAGATTLRARLGMTRPASRFAA